MGFSGFDFRDVDKLAKVLENFADTPGFAKACRSSLEQGQNYLYNIEKEDMKNKKGKYSNNITSPELVKSKVYRIKKGKNKGNYRCSLGFNWGDKTFEVYKFYHTLENGYRLSNDGKKIELDTPKKNLLDDNLVKNEDVIASKMETIIKDEMKIER